MKTCFKCGEEKPLSAFYRHKMMADGHLNKCKECTKVDVHKNREKNIDHYRAYDRKRGNRLPPGYCKEYRKKYPNKYRAQRAVNNAIRSGKMKKMPCEVCGSEDHVHGHHDDYRYPLNVRWLCAAHHAQWHRDHGEAKNP